MRTISKIRRFIRQIRRSDVGSTTVEYAVLLALVCGILAASVRSLGTANANVLTKLSDFLETAAEGPPQIKRPPKR
jgi:Flp pilus assembly pilin Flp